MPLTLNVLSVRPNADGIITRISTAADGTQANGHSYGAQVTADGHYVVFLSDAEQSRADAAFGAYKTHPQEPPDRRRRADLGGLRRHGRQQR